jgi:hypothetical protein
MKGIEEMSAVLSNSTFSYLVVVDDAMRNDVHNGMILISTTLGVVLAGFVGAFVAYRRMYARQVAKPSQNSLTPVAVNTNA